jgi:hypothetical protein
MKLPWTKRIANVGGGLIMSGLPKRAELRLKAPVAWDCPETLDNSAYCTPLENQGQNPWCGAYSGCQLLQASYWREHGRKVQFDEATMYRHCKGVDGLQGDGTSLEAVLTVIEQFDVSGSGLRPRITEERMVEDAGDIMFAVHRYGLVMCGLAITDGWTYPKWNGMIGPGTRPLGGHAVLCSGYSLRSGIVFGPNWWGTNWGRRGFWYMSRDQFARQFMYGYGVRLEWPS